MTRKCILLIFDKDGIIDDYLKYYIESLSKFVNEFLFVVNGKLDDTGRDYLSSYPGDILIRDNEGYDASGYLAGITHLGYESLKTVDELIIANDSVYGPIFPFSEMFDEMSSRNELDFWGITGHRALFDGTKLIMNAHIQSYFMVFRNRLISDEAFRKYWDNIPVIHNRDEAISKHETYVTHYFERKGYLWETYIPINHNEKTHPNDLIVDPIRSLSSYRCPVIKRSMFSYNDSSYLNDARESGLKVRSFINNHTDYNFSLIEKNLLRVYPLNELMASLNLYRYVSPALGTNMPSSSLKSAAIIDLYYPDKLDEMLSWIMNLPENIDLFLISNNLSVNYIKQKFAVIPNHIEIRTVPNRGRFAAAYLIGCKDIFPKYDIFLLFHDKKSSYLGHAENAENFFYKLAANVLASRQYVNNILNLFEQEQNLGLLVQTLPVLGTYYGMLGNEWGDDFLFSKQLLFRLGCQIDINENFPPVAPFGDIYWARSKALAPIFEYDWMLSDFPNEPVPPDGTILHALERIPCYVAQSQGYYSAYLFNTDYAGIEQEMYQTYLRGWNKLFNKYTAGHRWKEALEYIMGDVNISMLTEFNTSENIVLTRQMLFLPFSTRLRLWFRKYLPKKIYRYIESSVKKIKKIPGDVVEPWEPTDLELKKTRIFSVPNSLEIDGETIVLPFTTRVRVRLRKLLPARIYNIFRLYGKDKPEFEPWEKEVLGIPVYQSFAEDVEIDNYSESDIRAIHRYSQNANQKEGVSGTVSVIIPCYNHAKFLPERINPIINQDHPVFECIFLDDASTDNSIEVARECLKDAPFPVHWILNEKNSGNAFSQWKKGIEKASGNYIWIAESDDSCATDFLSVALIGMTDSRVVLSYTDSSMIDEKGDPLFTSSREIFNIIHKNPRWNSSYINDGTDEIGNHLAISNYILNASGVVLRNIPQLLRAISEAGNYRICGDWYVYLSILHYGDIAYSSEILNYCRMHAGNVRSSVSRDTEYLEICDIHSKVLSDNNISLKTVKRMREQRDSLGVVSLSVRKKRIAWVVDTPITKGSGGHRTVINHANALVLAGYDCDIYFYKYNNNVDIARLIEENFGYCCCNIYIGEKLKEDYDLVIATTWDSAYVVQRANCRKKAYFIQDYEPWFFDEKKLIDAAEATYHMGFYPVTIGSWLQHKISSYSEVPARYYDFCVQTDDYYNLNLIRKKAVCAVYQPEKIRRNAPLVAEILKEVHRLDPTVELITFGSGRKNSDLSEIGVNQIGVISISDLNKMYNECSVGVCLSFSNPSRIPFEMMASGLCVVEVKGESTAYDYPEDIISMVEPDAVTMASEIVRMINDKSECEARSKAGAKRMKEYPLQRAYDTFIEEIRAILAI